MAEARKNKGGFGCGTLLGGGFVILFLVSVAGGFEVDPNVPEPPSVSTLNDVDVAVACEQRVRDSLTSPSTAKFPGMFSSDYAKAYRVEGGWEYPSYVDSQNGFGATVRTDFLCQVDANDLLSVSFAE